MHSLLLACAAVVLAENGRLKYLDKIVETFGKIVSAARGEVIATITTAEVNGAAWRACRVFSLQSMYAAQTKLQLGCPLQAAEVMLREPTFPGLPVACILQSLLPRSKLPGPVHPGRPRCWTCKLCTAALRDGCPDQSA